MLFHVGALWRLNELSYLPRLARVSSVSGGSITAATLGLRWSELAFDANGFSSEFGARLVDPVRELAGETIDAGAVLTGLLTGDTIAERVAGAYRKHLFGEATLQQLPTGDPRFVINATNLQTGALWRFSQPYMADYQVGMIPTPDVELAVAVAASSAFPPILSPLRLKVDPDAYAAENRGPLFRPPFTTDVVLSDGGVYDNLGLQTAWGRCKTVLVSDGGGQMAPEPDVKSDWPRQALRVNSVIDNQVRNLRKRQAIAGFASGERDGTYWGIRGHVADYGPPPGSLPCPPQQTELLAKLKTRLEAMDAVVQERLINWGYAICDVAMRTWVEPKAAPPAGFPYPGAGIG